MAWTTPGTVAPGEVYTASRYNTDTVGNLEYLKAETDGIGLVLITSSSFTTQATVSVNNCFTSAYDGYKIVVSHLGSTLNVLSMRLRVGGSDQATGTNYAQVAYRALSQNVSGLESANEAANQWEIAKCDDTAFPSIGIVEVFRPAVAARTIAMGHMTIAKTTTSEAQIRMYGYSHQQATSYDGFSLIADTGTSSGYVAVYGYKV